MGVPKFSAYLKSKKKDPNFNKVWTKEMPKNVISLAIDMNGTIHRAMSMVYGYGDYRSDIRIAEVKKMKQKAIDIDIISAIQYLLIEAIKQIKPTHTLIIAVDGKVPVAKIQQQRQRRYLSSQTRKPGEFDGTVITPGTDFMFKLDSDIKSMLSGMRDQLPPRLIYSSHLSPGEGEHKIMEYYRTLKFASGNHFLYGMDADLIFLSLMSPLDGIILKQEDKIDLLDIDMLKEWVLSLTEKEELKKTAVHDFVIMMLSLGNDFIPHGPTHNSMGETIEKMLSVWDEVGKCISKEGPDVNIIDFKVLGEIYILNVDNQQELISKEASDQYEGNYEKGWKMKGKNNIFVKDNKKNNDEIAKYYLEPIKPKIKDDIYEKAIVNDEENEGVMFDINVYKPYWYSNEVNGMEIDLSALSINMSMKYLEGMAWTFTYYQTKHVDWYWFYPYFHAPLFSEIGVLADEYSPSNYYSEEEPSYSIIDQLLCVIPPRSFENTLPELLQGIVRDSKNITQDLYPLRVKVESFGIIESHISTTLVPKANINRIMLTTSILKKRDKSKWETKPSIIDRSTEESVLFYKKYIKDIPEKEYISYDSKREQNRKFVKDKYDNSKNYDIHVSKDNISAIKGVNKNSSKILY